MKPAKVTVTVYVADMPEVKAELERLELMVELLAERLAGLSCGFRTVPLTREQIRDLAETMTAHTIEIPIKVVDAPLVASKDFGVVLDADGAVDRFATDALAWGFWASETAEQAAKR